MRGQHMFGWDVCVYGAHAWAWCMHGHGACMGSAYTASACMATGIAWAAAAWLGCVRVCGACTGRAGMDAQGTCPPTMGAGAGLRLTVCHQCGANERRSSHAEFHGELPCGVAMRSCPAQLPCG
eukprot:208310-Chlamydomonas_euryale.AAC.1